MAFLLNKKSYFVITKPTEAELQNFYELGHERNLETMLKVYKSIVHGPGMNPNGMIKCDLVELESSLGKPQG